ncbi:MAG: hypothetical protein ACKVP7_16335 [Hyphomicrobiaceae bacterium]
MRFEPFGTTYDGSHVLWRHDIDYSIQHAASIAQIEADHGVRATYFVLLGSPYYNLFELEATLQLRAIVNQGHWLGLHFDPERHGQLGTADMELAMKREAEILSDLSQSPVTSVSFHNPGLAGVLHMDGDRLGGLLNVYSRQIRERYAYCSDSFGSWRHRPLHDVINDEALRHLHLLTHPIWWQAKPMGSRERIKACVQAHSDRLDRIYDDLLARAGQLEAVMAADKFRGFKFPAAPSWFSGG